MSLKSAIVRQFGKPTGLAGKLAGHIMARRSSNRIRNRATVELMNLQPDSRVLEVGCGPGLALALCAETISDGRIVGLDHSPVMIEQARSRLMEQSQWKSVELLVGGIDCLDDWVGAFDRVYSLNVIQFIDDKSGYFRRAISVLDRGGKCFTTYQPRLDNEGQEGACKMAGELAQLMQTSGFIEIGQFSIDAGPTPAFCIHGTKSRA